MLSLCVLMTLFLQNALLGLLQRMRTSFCSDSEYAFPGVQYFTHMKKLNIDADWIQAWQDFWVRLFGADCTFWNA